MRSSGKTLYCCARKCQADDEACAAAAVLERMPLADAVINEGLRLHSIVDGVWREALDDLEVDGFLVPKARPVLQG